MNFTLLRHKMVAEQLARRDIHDPRVLAAMERVPREAFVPVSLRGLAYEDRALPIGFEQTISQPYTVAFMCQAARLRPRTRCSRSARVQAMVRRCWRTWPAKSMPIERIGELYETATDCADGMPDIKMCDCISATARLGLPTEAPFDVILCTAGAETLPVAFQEQLAEGGRLVIPIGPPSHQQMYRFTRRGDEWYGDKLGSFGFVPLVAGDAS